MRAKYLVWDDGHGLERAEIFDSITAHANRARDLGVTDKVTSAGEFSMGVEEVNGCPTPKAFAFGRSTTLGVTSSDEDGRLIDQLLRIGEYYGR